MDALIRTQLSLPKSQKRIADQIASWQNVSLAEVYRRAMDDYIKNQEKKRAERVALADRLAGSLKNSKTWKNINASAWQRELRREQGI